MFQHLRANALAASAFAVALTGTAIAIAGLPHNSVGTKQIKKAAVHKSDIHEHAVSTSKLDTGVLRMQGIASNAGFSGSIPTNTPEFSLADTQLTTTRAGRVFGFARGAYSATCNVGNARVGLYLDGVALGGSGAPLVSGAGPTELNVWGLTAGSVSPGGHTHELRVDCISGNNTGTGSQGDVAIGAIVLRD